MTTMTLLKPDGTVDTDLRDAALTRMYFGREAGEDFLRHVMADRNSDAVNQRAELTLNLMFAKARAVENPASFLDIDSLLTPEGTDICALHLMGDGEADADAAQWAAVSPTRLMALLRAAWSRM